jgi:hypothetical protein
MISNIPMTKAQCPAFGVSADGHTFVERTGVSAPIGVQVSTYARIRTTGYMALAAQDDFPGTQAWRPPNC